jgi:superfamily I DNA/RNA helicase
VSGRRRPPVRPPARRGVWAERLEASPDDEARLRTLHEAKDLKASNGQSGNWPGCDVAEIRQAIKDVKAEAEHVRKRVVNGLLRRIAYRLALDTMEAARTRQAEGRLEFHDLLVLARELVRSETHGREVRARLQDRYRRILLDEFQDADPIQIELAVRIAAGAAGGAGDWQDVQVPEGALFVVGDPKQSIYRFRRADIATYLEAQRLLGRELHLTTNFRTAPSVLDWVNTVFEPTDQPARGLAAGLSSARPSARRRARRFPRGDARSRGAPCTDEGRAGPGGRGSDVAATYRGRRARRMAGLRSAGRLASRAARRHRRARAARTSLPQLEAALDAGDVPFRAEASSLVYRTPEVRDSADDGAGPRRPERSAGPGQRPALARLRLRRRRPLDVEARGRDLQPPGT